MKGYTVINSNFKNINFMFKPIFVFILFISININEYERLIDRDYAFLKEDLSSQFGLDATTEFLETSNINDYSSYSIEDNVKNLKDVKADLQEEADELEKESANTQSPLD